MDVVLANNFSSRLFGHMFKTKIDFIYKFDNCNSIHTFFMMCDIDVYMVDKNNKVLFVFKNLGKNKIIWPKKDVFTVYETPIGYWNYSVLDIIKKDV